MMSFQMSPAEIFEAFHTGFSWQLAVISVLVSFSAAGLRGFQHKNVIGNHRWSIFFTSYAIGFTEVASVGLVIKGGWWIALTAGTGAAFGMLLSISLHDRWMSKRALKAHTRI